MHIDNDIVEKLLSHASSLNSAIFVKTTYVAMNDSDLSTGYFRLENIQQ